MYRQHIIQTLRIAILFFGIGQVSLAQKAQINGRITDSSGGVVVGASITVTNVDTGIKRTAASNEEGYYTVALLQPGNYGITVEMQGFKPIKRSGIKLDVYQVARVDFVLEIGEMNQIVDVTANASPLNFENAEHRENIRPDSLKELPLLVNGNIRTATGFVILMPGVTTGGGGSPFDARFNGGMQSGDEAVLDGATMQDGMYSQSGMTEAYTDHPLSAESISEVSVLTSNYEPQYGSTTSAVITAVTKNQGPTTSMETCTSSHATLRSTRASLGFPKSPRTSNTTLARTLAVPSKSLGWLGQARRSPIFLSAMRVGVFEVGP